MRNVRGRVGLGESILTDAAQCPAVTSETGNPSLA